MILGEVLTVLNYGIWFLGLVTIIGLIVGLLYTLLVSSSIDIGENRGESSIYDRDSQVAVQPIAFRSTGDILDECREHRNSLKRLHAQLCSRSGIEPTQTCPLGDLITEAVFDGRQQYNCINAVDQATQERNVEQHA
jgi:hypothetical protein